MIQWLLAKEEGPDTFWGKTKFNSLTRAKNLYPELEYRKNGQEIEVLQGSSEGPSTFWHDFDSNFNTVEQIMHDAPPADSRSVLRVDPKEIQ